MYSNEQKEKAFKTLISKAFSLLNYFTSVRVKQSANKHCYIKVYRTSRGKGSDKGSDRIN